MIRLVVVDMDGTLLNDKKEIDPSFWKIAEALKDKNILLAAASGRQYYTLLHQFDSIKNDMVLISDNGAFVADKDGEISHVALGKDAVRRIKERGKDVPNAWLVCSGLKRGYVEYNGKAFLEKVSTYYASLEVVEDFNDVDDEIIKMTFCDFENAKENSANYFRDFENEFSVVVAGEYWLDITPKIANKGLAVEALQKAKNISPEETMLFGDYHNDISMMSKAKYSFAMKNAQPEVLAAANYVTKLDNNHNGVVETLKEWLHLDV